MKNKFFILTSLLILLLAGCKKDEKQNYYEGGTAPVLSASSTSPVVLQLTNATQTAIGFNWTNPDYKFTTGVSSQNVTYTLQVDTAGDNFKHAQAKVVTSDLATTLTVKELNTMLTKLELAEDMPHNIEFRLMTSLNNSSVPLYSNVIAIKVTPYLDVAIPLPVDNMGNPVNVLYLTGDAMPSGWTNTPPITQKMTPDPASLTSTGRPTKYFATVALAPGKFYKFLTTQGYWQPQYGAAINSGYTASGGDVGYNLGSGSDPDAIPTPSSAGTYTVTINFKTGKYTVQ